MDSSTAIIARLCNFNGKLYAKKNESFTYFGGFNYFFSFFLAIMLFLAHFNGLIVVWDQMGQMNAKKENQSYNFITALILP